MEKLPLNLQLLLILLVLLDQGSKDELILGVDELIFEHYLKFECGLTSFILLICFCRLACQISADWYAHSHVHLIDLLLDHARELVQPDNYLLVFVEKHLRLIGFAVTIGPPDAVYFDMKLVVKFVYF